MRSIVDVVNELRVAMPNEYEEELNSVIEHASYRAPEIQGQSWMELSEVVSHAVDIEPETNIEEVDVWKLIALRILMDKRSISEVKDMHNENHNKKR